MPDRMVGIVGVGMIGGSLARALVRAGVGGSRADLFARAAVWVKSRADDKTRAAIEWLWATAGAAEVQHHSSEAHDRTMAWVSHLPQPASVAVAAALERADVPAQAGGPGLRDVTRLVASPPELWRDVLGAAPPATVDALDALRDALVDLRNALAAADAAALSELWSRAGSWRACAAVAA